MYLGRQVVRYWPYSWRGVLRPADLSAGLTPTGSANGATEGSEHQHESRLCALPCRRMRADWKLLAMTGRAQTRALSLSADSAEREVAMAVEDEGEGGIEVMECTKRLCDGWVEDGYGWCR
jgi:hypothetical protein